MFEEDKRFDEMIRSVLSEGTEDVPASVWNSVRERLDRDEAGRNRVILLRWLRSSAVAAGIAAAIAVGVIFFGTSDLNITAPETSGIAVITADSAEENDLTASVFEMSGPGRIIADSRRITVDKAPAGNAMDAAERETVQETTGGDSATSENAAVAAGKPKRDKNKYDSGKEEENHEDDFLFDEEPDRERKARASFVVSGNAVSNSTSKNGVFREINPPSLNSPSPASPTQNTVSETGESTYGIPLSFGIGAKIFLTDRWSVAAGFNYTHLSRSFAGNYIQVNDNGEIETKVFSSISNVQDYVGIPVNAYYSILRNNLIDFYTYFGGTAEKCVSNRYIMKSEPENFIHREKVKGLQFSVNAGIGMEFIIANQIGLYIDPNIRYYFNNGQPKSIRTTYKNNILLGFEAGLRVRL